MPSCPHDRGRQERGALRLSGYAALGARTFLPRRFASQSEATGAAIQLPLGRRSVVNDGADYTVRRVEARAGCDG